MKALRQLLKWWPQKKRQVKRNRLQPRATSRQQTMITSPSRQQKRQKTREPNQRKKRAIAGKRKTKTTRFDNKINSLSMVQGAAFQNYTLHTQMIHNFFPLDWTHLNLLFECVFHTFQKPELCTHNNRLKRANILWHRQSNINYNEFSLFCWFVNRRWTKL